MGDDILAWVQCLEASGAGGCWHIGRSGARLEVALYGHDLESWLAAIEADNPAVRAQANAHLIAREYLREERTIRCGAGRWGPELLGGAARIEEQRDSRDPKGCASRIDNTNLQPK